MPEINLRIPRISSDPITLTLKNGDQLFIVGPNGSGKSALMQRFALNRKFKWITAHRRTWISSAKNNLTPDSRQKSETNRRSYISNPAARWTDSHSENDWSAILFDLEAKENAIDKSIAQHVRNQNTSEAKKIAAESRLPFDQMNELLGLGRLKVTLERAENRSLLARHPQGNPFSVVQMSDGERNAMIIAGHVITAVPGTVFLIDEPERHLHRSITQPFLSALFDLRSEDCTFIISTHEIGLPVANADAQILMLRSCQWSGDQCVAWDAEVIEPDSELPEDLKLAVLGSRDRILFVEGDSTGSLDFPLYTALFPDVSVIPKGSCEEVQKAVLGLRGSQDQHHIEAFGLIDQDGRMDDIENLAEKGVFALEVYSAESLYYCSDAIAAVANRQAESLSEDKNKLIESSNNQAIDVIKEHARRMVARKCERHAKETLSKELNWKTIMDNQSQFIEVSINNPFTDELNNFNKLVEDGNLDKLIARYPVRESCAFATVANALKCQHKNDYERMVITQIPQDNELAKKLKKRIGPLSEVLESS
jgi:ABC-type lipoprotein export system ATPase subunit